MTTIVLVQGLPGSGKTTLADHLSKLIHGCARINADQIRATISADLKFSMTDRKMQAYRLGCISAIALMKPIQVIGGSGDDCSNHNSCVVVDFVNPTEETRDIFRWAVKSTLVSTSPIKLVEIWMNTIDTTSSRFKDTNKVYQPPKSCDYTVTGWKTEDQLKTEAKLILADLFKPQRLL